LRYGKSVETPPSVGSRCAVRVSRIRRDTWPHTRRPALRFVNRLERRQGNSRIIERPAVDDWHGPDEVVEEQGQRGRSNGDTLAESSSKFEPSAKAVSPNDGTSDGIQQYCGAKIHHGRALAGRFRYPPGDRHFSDRVRAAPLPAEGAEPARRRLPPLHITWRLTNAGCHKAALSSYPPTAAVRGTFVWSPGFRLRGNDDSIQQ